MPQQNLIARLIKLLIQSAAASMPPSSAATACRFAALAEREGVSPSYFTRLVRLSYLAPDITQAILDGRQPPRPDRRQAAGALASAAGLARSTDRARLCLGRSRALSSIDIAKSRAAKPRVAAGAATVANRIGDTAVLEYRPTETLPLQRRNL